MEEKKRLPKNVRQVGEKDELIRIYIEDYANTYLEKCAGRQGELTIGVLVGESCVIDGNACMFITGALEVNHVWSGEDQLLFSEYSWERMLKQKGRHFGDAEICGCFACAPDEMVPDQAVLTKLSNRYFSETGNVMMVVAREDSAVYYQSVASMTKLAGYYIYYERNEAMQEFLVESSQGHSTHSADQGEVVVNQFRERMNEKKQARTPAGARLAYGLSLCMALCLGAVGINSLSSSQKLAQLEEALTVYMEKNDAVGATVSQTDSVGGQLIIYEAGSGGTAADETTGSDEETSETATESGESGSETTPAAADALPETTAGETEEAANADVSQTETPETAAPETTAQSLASEEETAADETPVSVIPENCMTYTVAQGDTLSSICIRFYGSHDNLEYICSLNNIEDPNVIEPGQTLVVPVADQEELR